jgi:hypothetical protein
MLSPKTDYTLRLVRVTKRPITAGESYRLFVDELPDPKTRQNRVITLVMRYSIPAFFYPHDTADAKLAWSVEQRSGQVYVSATNDGDRHVRVAALRPRVELIFFMLALTLAAGPPRPDSALAAEESRQLQLEVHVNDASARLIGSFTQLPDRRIAARRAELAEIGLKVPGSGSGDELVNHR